MNAPDTTPTRLANGTLLPALPSVSAAAQKARAGLDAMADAFAADNVRRVMASIVEAAADGDLKSQALFTRLMLEMARGDIPPAPAVAVQVNVGREDDGPGKAGRPA